MATRFKIDSYDMRSLPFALYRGKPKWHAALTGAVRWEIVATDKDRQSLVEYYELIKDLPQYLE